MDTPTSPLGGPRAWRAGAPEHYVPAEPRLTNSALLHQPTTGGAPDSFEGPTAAALLPSIDYSAYFANFDARPSQQHLLLGLQLDKKHFMVSSIGNVSLAHSFRPLESKSPNQNRVLSFTNSNANLNLNSNTNRRATRRPTRC